MTKKTLCKEQNFRGDYNNIFSKTMNFIGINCFSDIGKCEEVKIEQNKISTEEIDYIQLERKIEKHLIKNKLFIVGVKKEANAVVIETTKNGIYDLLFVPEFDEENYKANELQEIRQEIEEEEPTDEQKEEIRREQAIEDYENCKKEHEKSCPKCESIATNLAPNGAGVEEETYWHCEKCGWGE
ncbi:hypothetical protein EXN13_15595 [Clostridium botulinum]|nr:hypothetical protein [Clostridium botulinum]